MQTIIIKNLIHNEEYTRQVIPFLKKEYFSSSHQTLFNLIIGFVDKYNSLPSKEAFIIELENDSEGIVNVGEFSGIVDSVFSPADSDTDQQWLLDTTEKWCQDRAIHIAIMESINIIDGKSKEMTKNAIPEILSDALGISFDRNIGHDYVDSAESRYEFYNKVEKRVPFDLEYFNKITKGGLPNKTLNIVMAGTGVGKSLFMCHVAGGALMQNKNVLYITMEMAEERIAERIDANLLNIALDDIESVGKKTFINKVTKISSKTTGKLIVKEYPTASAHVGHFRALLNELKLKKNFMPDIIFVDYLNICASSRIKGLGGSVNTYSYIKSIAEELRGLAVEYDVPILSATQTTRSGFGNSDVGLEDTSESFGLPATADMMFALIATEELDNLNQIMVKQLKNRYADLGTNKRFVVGVDRSKMRLYDVEASAQNLIQVDSGGTSNNASSNPNIPSKKKLDSSGFKF